VAESRPVLDAPRETARGVRHVVTAVEFDILWERLGLGPTPVVLRLPSPGRAEAERREVRAAGWQTLRERGLAGPAGPDPELVRVLRLLARPAEQLELRGTWGRAVAAVAAGRPDDGMLAVRQDATVTLESCGALPAALLGALPTAPPGPGRASTVPTSVLTAALGAGEPGLRAALIARDVSPGEAGLLARMLAGGGGRAQIVALATDASGIPRRSGEVVGVIDSPGGRYLMTRTVGDDGVEWTTVAPTDQRGLRHRVVRLLAAAARDAVG